MTISFGSFRLDRQRRLLLRDDRPVRIGSRALDLLIALIDRPGVVVGPQELLDLVWRGVVVDEAGVRVQIASLRRILGDGRDGARYIVNVPGRGYSFVAPINDPDEPAPRPAPRVPRSTGDAPPPPRSLIGRERVVNNLVELLLARRFISIVGSGGIGKTTVAVAMAEKLRDEFDDENVVFVDLGAVSDPDLVPGAVISAVGCTLGGSDPVTELLSFVADRRMLIVFDSCEHLVDPTSLLAGQLFHRAPGVHLLITSRELLRVEGETVHLLSPLAYPVDKFPTAAEALATSAVQLFMYRAKLSGFGGELSDIEAPVVSEICRRTDGIALAIELAASRVGTYGISGVADLLASNAELQLKGRRNVPARHQTLEAMLDWSFKLLTEDERRILSRLSVFVGLFTMEAACSVAGEEGRDRDAVAFVLANLVEKSLVWVHPADEAVFYRLPDTTRAYAAFKLAEIDAPEPVAQRHAGYFAALFKVIALEHGAYAEIGRYAPHIGNVRKALEWSFSNKEHRAMGAALAADTAPLFLGLWLLAECRHWSHLALSAIEDSGGTLQWEARLQEAWAISSMHTLGTTTEVREAIERGLHLSEASEQGLPQLRLLAGLNLFLTRLGDFDGALTAAKRCGAIAERSGSPSDRVISEWLLAAAHHLAGDQAAAVAYCERGFQLEAATGRVEINLFGYDHHLRAKIGLARALWLRGSPESALRLALESLDEAWRLPPPGNYGMAAIHSVPVLLWSGNTEESVVHIERALSHAERHSFKGHEAAALALKGEWLSMTGQPSAGVETLQEAIKMLYREQLLMVVPAASRALADALARSGRYNEARVTIDTAVSSARKMIQKFWLPELLRTQAEIMLDGPSPDADAAEPAFRESIELARDQSATAWELRAAVPLARLLLQQGRTADMLALVGPIYEAHSEKSGTKDLVEAAAILTAVQRRPDPRN